MFLHFNVSVGLTFAIKMVNGSWRCIYIFVASKFMQDTLWKLLFKGTDFLGKIFETFREI